METTSPASAPALKKRGRKPLSPAQRIASIAKRRAYLQHYYQQNKEKRRGYDYQHSCIYMLTSPDTDKVYIGGTALPLPVRLAKHRYAMATKPSSTHQRMLALSQNWDIERVVACSVKSRHELEDLETLWISALAEQCVNQSKKYPLDVVQHLLDGRFRSEYLPPTMRNHAPSQS